MQKENFERLLNDLYAEYSPAKITEVPKLMDKYNGQEFDCIKYFFMVYNFRASEKYDAKVGTDKHVRDLIELYDKGEKMTIVTTKEQMKSEIEGLLENVGKSKEEAIENLFQEKMAKIDKYFNDKELFLRSIEKAADFQGRPGNIEVRYDLNFDGTLIDVPAEVDDMATGSRMLILDKNGAPCGLHVIDILYDAISEPGKCIKKITINRI